MKTTDLHEHLVPRTHQLVTLNHLRVGAVIELDIVTCLLLNLDF